MDGDVGVLGACRQELAPGGQEGVQGGGEDGFIEAKEHGRVLGGGQENRVSLALFNGLLDGAEDLGDFAFKYAEVQVDYGAAGMEDDVDGGMEERKVFANSLAETALNAVAVDRLAEDLTDGKADAGSVAGTAEGAAVGAERRAKGEEETDLFRKLLAAGLVGALEVGVFAEAVGSGEHGVSFSLARRMQLNRKPVGSSLFVSGSVVSVTIGGF